MRKNRSFSLIELLLVISITGILAALTYSMMSSSRRNARDTIRKTDLQSFHFALVNYKQVNGFYPKIDSSNASCTTASSTAKENWIGPSIPNLTNELRPYLSPLPLDPLNPGCGNAWFAWFASPSKPSGYVYVSDISSGQYAMWASLENTRDQDRNGASAQDDKNGPPYTGKYSTNYYYQNIVNLVKDYPTNDNVAQLYSVGCRLVVGKCVDN